MELIEANPTYARIRYPDGRQSLVSLRDIARYPREDEMPRENIPVDDGDPERQDVPKSSNVENEQYHEDVLIQGGRSNVDQSHASRNEREEVVYNEIEQPTIVEETTTQEPRRSARHNRGVPPDRYGLGQFGYDT